MATHLIRKDYGSDKYYLINNFDGSTSEITKTGEHIKKFSLDLTGKLGFRQRQLQSDPSHVASGTESLKKFPQFYIPQPDKFDGYAQLPRTLQQPFYNNHKARSDATIEVTIDFVRQQSKNSIHQIEKPIAHITGTMNDFNFVQSLKKIKWLEHRKTTKQRNFTSHMNSVKVINKQEIQPPNLTFLRRSRIKSQLLPKTLPFPLSNSREPSEIRNIVPLEDKEMKSIHQFQQYQSEHKESEILYESRTFNKSQSRSQMSRIDMRSSLCSVHHFQEQVRIAQQEEMAYELPKQKDKQQISSKGRFSSVKTKSNGDQYVTDRIIMKLCISCHNRSSTRPVQMNRYIKSLIIFSLLLGSLYDYQQEVFIWCNEDLILFRLNSQKCQIIGWIQISHQ